MAFPAGARSLTPSALWMRLPLTRVRLLVAHLVYRGLKLAGYADRRRVVRGGITYDIDLSQALGLSVFLFGSFQGHLVRPRLFSLPAGAVVIDVGANIGVLTLRFAQLAPRGRVYAFEPTDYAYQELLHNLALNPTLAARIEPVKAFLSERSGQAPAPAAYASWSVSDWRPGPQSHSLHGGTLMAATAAPTRSLDDFCRDHQLDRIDFIKIDTDGHELEVLRGARETLRRFHPFVVFEVGLYLLADRGQTLRDFFDLLEPLGYRLINTKNGRPVTREGYPREIPLRATTDVLAIH